MCGQNADAVVLVAYNLCTCTPVEQTGGKHSMSVAGTNPLSKRLGGIKGRPARLHLSSLRPRSRLRQLLWRCWGTVCTWAAGPWPCHPLSRTQQRMGRSRHWRFFRIQGRRLRVESVVLAWDLRESTEIRGECLKRPCHPQLRSASCQGA